MTTEYSSTKQVFHIFYVDAYVCVRVCMCECVYVCVCVCVFVSSPRWAMKPLLVILTQFSQTHSDHGNGPRRYLLIWDDERNGKMPFLLLQKHSLSQVVPWGRALVKIVFIVTQNMFLQIIYFADI